MNGISPQISSVAKWGLGNYPWVQEACTGALSGGFIVTGSTVKYDWFTGVF